MYGCGYEIPVNESAYSARERYFSDKKNAENAIAVKEAYRQFLTDSRDYFLTETLNMFLQNSLDENTSQDQRNYGKALVEGFVKQQDSIKLLTDFSKKSMILSSIANLVNESQLEVLHSCKEGDKNTFKISKTIDRKFFDSLEGLNDSQITEKINKRVCCAIEDYIESNKEDKDKLEELANKTKEKIDNIKARSAEEKEKITKEFTESYQRQVNSIKARNGRKIGLYEQLVHSLTNEIVRDASILEAFTNEDGKLNIEGIRENVTVMYTFLEMLNTMKVSNVNEKFIMDIIK